jgi:four helix bundle protein
MDIFVITKGFPKNEAYSLTDQIRRSSRSVSANLSEAWAKRRYENHWISKLSDCQAEAMETQNWLLYAQECGYMESQTSRRLLQDYDALIGSLQKMIEHSSEWTTA